MRKEKEVGKVGNEKGGLRKKFSLLVMIESKVKKVNFLLLAFINLLPPHLSLNLSISLTVSLSLHLSLSHALSLSLSLSISLSCL